MPKWHRFSPRKFLADPSKIYLQWWFSIRLALVVSTVDPIQRHGSRGSQKSQKKSLSHTWSWAKKDLGKPLKNLPPAMIELALAVRGTFFWVVRGLPRRPKIQELPKWHLVGPRENLGRSLKNLHPGVLLRWIGSSCERGKKSGAIALSCNGTRFPEFSCRPRNPKNAEVTCFRAKRKFRHAPTKIYRPRCKSTELAPVLSGTFGGSGFATYRL